MSLYREQLYNPEKENPIHQNEPQTALRLSAKAPHKQPRKSYAQLVLGCEVIIFCRI
jgi:hypothetical protein